MSSETLNDFTVCKEVFDCVCLAQSVDHLSWEHKAAGSNPGTNNYESTITMQSTTRTHPFSIRILWLIFFTHCSLCKLSCLCVNENLCSHTIKMYPVSITLPFKVSSKLINDFPICNEACDCGCLAQSVERLPFDHKFAGSNPGAYDSVYESTLINLQSYD